jgi:hypothetical protein
LVRRVPLGDEFEWLLWGGAASATLRVVVLAWPNVLEAVSVGVLTPVVTRGCPPLAASTRPTPESSAMAPPKIAPSVQNDGRFASGRRTVGRKRGRGSARRRFRLSGLPAGSMPGSQSEPSGGRTRRADGGTGDAGRPWRRGITGAISCSSSGGFKVPIPPLPAIHTLCYRRFCIFRYTPRLSRG